MSRNQPYIEQALIKVMDVKGAEFFQFEIFELDVRSDINLLSKHIVAKKMTHEDTTTQDEMASKMSDRSNGQFLWLRLLQNSLRNGLNKEELRNAVEKTPADLSSPYTQN